MPLVMRRRRLSAPQGPPWHALNVVHVITTLDTGGAEMMLTRLVSAGEQNGLRHSVIALGGSGVMASKLEDLGISFINLRLARHELLTGAWRLGNQLRRHKPNIIQTWMYHADLLGSMAALGLRNVPVVWNIRCGRLDRAIDKAATIWTSKLCAAISTLVPERIVCCSMAALEAHRQAGYDRTKLQLIHNGLDTSTFRPDLYSRVAVRKELGLAPDTPVVTLAARFHPAKDHATFCAAASRVAKSHQSVRFILCGTGVSPTNRILMGLLDDAEIVDRCHLLGPRDDMPRIFAASDVVVSSSAVEGFPNALAEGMACGLPAVTTAAGDSEFIVGDTGYVTPTHSPVELGSALLRMLNRTSYERAALGRRARQRIVDNFSLADAVSSYTNLYRELASTCAE
ncbi:MAG: glycosyltransferase [Bryobacterales bacterium]|nr:glycosyltransferase [Bryobacterales bacterium]